MQILLAFLTSFFIVLMVTPSLIKIARERKIFDEPGERKVHTSPTPLLGGISIFAGTLISFLFWSAGSFELPHLFVLVSLLVLFVTGFIDDLRPLAPRVKLFLQIVAAFSTVSFAGNSINGLHGLFGVYSLSGPFSIVISVLFVLIVTNAFNFIDGIDGLAASIGIVASAFFGALFLSVNDSLYAILAFTLCGSLISFSLFNFSPAKIFMGDTGTLITGFILSLLAIQLTEGTRGTETGLIQYRSAPVFTLALLIVPIVDFIRVTSVRMMKGHSPIRADKNHIHHILVNLGFSHRQTVGLLLFINLLFIFSAFILRERNQSLVFFSFLFSGLLLSQIPWLLLKIKTKKIPL